jgi:hypothetical protein
LIGKSTSLLGPTLGQDLHGAQVILSLLMSGLFTSKEEEIDLADDLLPSFIDVPEGKFAQGHCRTANYVSE